MLKIDKKRIVNARFVVEELVNGQSVEVVIKETSLTFDNDGVCTLSESMYDAKKYAEHRKTMRKDEQELRDLRYKIEDEILENIAKKE